MAENHKPLKQEEFGETTAARGGARGGRRVALNVFDLIVILLVLAVVVMLVIGIRTGNLFGREEGTQVRLTYTVLLTNVDRSYAKHVRAGDRVYDAESGVALGTVSVTPAVTDYCVVGLQESDEESAEQVAVMLPVPDRVNVTLTIVCDAHYFEGKGYETEGRTMRIGDVYALRFPNYVGEAVCSSLTAVKATN